LEAVGNVIVGDVDFLMGHEVQRRHIQVRTSERAVAKWRSGLVDGVIQSLIA
jgi:hypothetical protein